MSTLFASHYMYHSITERLLWPTAAAIICPPRQPVNFATVTVVSFPGLIQPSVKWHGRHGNVRLPKANAKTAWQIDLPQVSNIWMGREKSRITSAACSRPSKCWLLVQNIYIYPPHPKTCKGQSARRSAVLFAIFNVCVITCFWHIVRKRKVF